MKDDVISRQAVIDALIAGEPYGIEYNINKIRELPSAQLEIVRCGECATRDKWGCPWWKDEVRPDDWFCADGERRK